MHKSECWDSEVVRERCQAVFFLVVPAVAQESVTTKLDTIRRLLYREHL